jgi:hypothetical protein
MKRTIRTALLIATLAGTFTLAAPAAHADACPPGYSWQLGNDGGMHCLNRWGYDPYGFKWR